VFGTDVVRISMIYFLTSSKTRQMVLLSDGGWRSVTQGYETCLLSGWGQKPG
jgi:hypothetical protein